MAAALVFSAGPAREASMPAGLEVVATGVPRPLQLALDRRTLVVLGPGARGDSAGEIYRVDLDGALPVDVTHRPRVRVPFLDRRLATLGSLALEPRTRDLFVGEENGSRVYRLDSDERLTLYVDGLRRLAGGSAIVFDSAGRLVLSSGGTLYRLVNGGLTPLATLPRGQYLRANLVGAPDGSVLMSGGFGVPMLFRISPDGAVTTLAGPLGDPQGIVLGGDGYL